MKSRRQYGASDKSRLLFHDRVVDGAAPAFVHDFDAEDLAGGGGAIFVGGGDGDVEGQNLIDVPGSGNFLEALDGAERDVIELVGRGVDGKRHVQSRRRVEGSSRVGGQIGRDLELGTEAFLLRPFSR